MKLTIFGASSPTGRLLVDKALAQGHEVTAFVRDEKKLGIKNAKLKILCGDALNGADVETAIEGCDAVLSTLGPKGKPVVMAAESTRNIVKAMERQGARRLIVISVAGICVPQDKRGFNLVDKLIRLFLKEVYLDRENQLAVLQRSNLDWVAVRVPRLTEEPPKGTVKAFFGTPSPTMKITRADVADFMVRQLTENQWLQKAPIISN